MSEIWNWCFAVSKAFSDYCQFRLQCWNGLGRISITVLRWIWESRKVLAIFHSFFSSFIVHATDVPTNFARSVPFFFRLRAFISRYDKVLIHVEIFQDSPNSTLTISSRGTFFCITLKTTLIYRLVPSIGRYFPLWRCFLWPLQLSALFSVWNSEVSWWHVALPACGC